VLVRQRCEKKILNDKVICEWRGHKKDGNEQGVFNNLFFLIQIFIVKQYKVFEISYLNVF
jgi:hypothetical protein